MNTGKILLGLLALHLIGLVLMAGTTVIDYVSFKLYWKIYALEKKTSKNLLSLMSIFSRLIGIGAALLIITGFGMMFVTRGVFGEQLWFRIKFGLVILLVANGLFFGRRLGQKQRQSGADPAFEMTPRSERLKSRLNLFYLSQLLIFAVIIFLSALKFN